MKELLSTITRKGQVTIPIEIRTALGLKPRDRVVFELEGDKVIIKPSPSRLAAGFGAIPPRELPEDFRRIRGEVEKTVAEEVREES